MKSNSSESSSKSWLDGVPTCPLTGVGYKMSEAYNATFERKKSLRGRDRTFYCKADNNTYLYAVFSGHNGTNLTDFALERLVAEILLGQLNAKTTEEHVKEVLRQAFSSVEKHYNETIESILAERTALYLNIPPFMSEHDISQKFPHVWKKIKSIDAQLLEGGSIVLALIHNSKLYVSNVGNCRALLCRKDENNVIKVIQLTADHNLSNEDEILRLRQTGLDVNKLKKFNLQTTRCIGCYATKGGYKTCSYLSQATSQPVISQPEIFGGQPVDDSFRFLILMSAGLCKCLEEIYCSESSQDNKEITQITVEQLRSQPTLNEVAQMTIEKVLQAHEEKYHVKARGENVVLGHEDVTILIRNFHFTMPHAIVVQKRNHVTFNPHIEHLVKANNGKDINGTYTSESASVDTLNSVSIGKERTTTHKKIKPYVQFNIYYENIAKARANGTLPPGIDFD